ncbi:MAG TPA: matrixin family metalloprotease [Nocardioidaceae bacterium]|nr:matrixin family metalloprotease [Nocardioidaceae bacterium]
MRRDDPDGWDWEAPRPIPTPVPMVEEPEPPSPYAPSFATKLLAWVITLLIFGGGAVYLLRYQLGLAEGHYAYLVVQPGNPDEPVRYPACQPLSYAVSGEGLDSEHELIDEAVVEIAAATGLRFVPLGSATEGATIVIRWTDSTGEPRLAGDTVGIGGSSSVVDPESGLRYFTKGRIDLDTPDLTTTLIQHGPEEVRAVMMHELGHVIGLDHVDDRNELMYQRNIGKTDFGPGDKEGLAILGKGPCLGQASP